MFVIMTIIITSLKLSQEFNSLTLSLSLSIADKRDQSNDYIN